MVSSRRSSLSISKPTETYLKNEFDGELHSVEHKNHFQELYRGFSPLMSFAFCFTVVNIFTSISLGFSFSLYTGGSAVGAWSWIIGVVFTILTGLSLAEICSLYPKAGSVYNWAGQLASPRHAPLASFICGWFNFIGNVAGDASFSSGFASIVNAILILDGKLPLSVNYQVAISVGITLMWTVQNAFRIDQQGWLNNLAAFFQMGSSIIVVIVLLVMAPQQASAHDVFLTTYNGTGFPFPYVCCISILATLFYFSGYEAGGHLAEETKNAHRAAPWGIIAACICSAIMGSLYLFALLFAIPNVSAFIERYGGDNESMNLIVATYKLAVPHAGATALTIILLLNIYFAGMSGFTVTSRIGFAMARDGVFPYSSYLCWTHPKTRIPLGNIILVFFLDCLLLLLQLVSTMAFEAIIATATLGYQLSYLVPILCRCTTARKTFPKGEFNLGRFGFSIAAVTSIWLIITAIFMFFPVSYPITKENMNYSIVIMGGILFIAAVYWVVSARHWFVGPIRIDQEATKISLYENGINTDSGRIRTSSDTVITKL